MKAQQLLLDRESLLATRITDFEGKEKEFVNQIAKADEAEQKSINVSFDRFIRTTDQDHVDFCLDFWNPNFNRWHYCNAVSKTIYSDYRFTSSFVGSWFRTSISHQLESSSTTFLVYLSISSTK